MQPTGLTLDVASTDGEASIAARGEMDLSNADRLRETAHRCLGEAPAAVVIDCSGLTFIDSTGIRTLLEILASGDERNVPVRIVSGERLRKVADILGVSQRLGIE